MILLVHLLFGAAIGSTVKNIPLAIVLAFLSHYFLDLIPHIDYPVKSTEKNQWHKILIAFLKVATDICAGILLILIFSKNQPIIYICGFAALIPDGLTVLKYLIPNQKILEAHYRLHQKIHFLEDKKISKFWRITSQVIVALISIITLRI